MLKDGVLSVLAGSGARGCNDGRGTEAMFAHPCGLTVSPEGTVFVADCGNHRIRQISPDGDVTTLAGSGNSGYKDGHGRHACFYNPCGIAIDYISNDVLYVSDYSNNCVRTVSRSGLVSTLARDLPATAETTLDSPYGIAVHIESLPGGGTENTVFVSSYHSHSLAVISPGGTVTTLAGCGAPRQADGYGASAAFHAPNGLAVDADGVLFVADSGNHCLRRITPDGEVVTIAGDIGCPSLSPSGLNSPCGLCVCHLPGHGPVLLVADRSNSCVRRLPVDALPPPLLAPSTMREDLSSLLDAECADFACGEATFQVEGQMLRAPKALLCARCPHFRAMFGSGMRESRAGEVIAVPDVSYVTYRALLDYLLSDAISDELGYEPTAELMMLANAYGVCRLEQLCARRLAARLSPDNMREIGHCASLIGEAHLQRAAEKFERFVAQQQSPEV